MTDKEKKELEVSKKKEIEAQSGEPTREGVVFVPDVDIVETEQGITLYADLPGVRKEDLDIDIREGVLALTATVEPLPAHHRIIYREYDVGGFQRRFTLGEKIDQGKISAELTHGVLVLHLPKAEAHKPRKIEIKS
ncbi:MAG: Hsp20/alpha crystallin family protein [Deltaproteobacteria bacterium]|nr:Hsp20/alpha crystallin family protein [Deltaproteobacteria bacterium]